MTINGGFRNQHLDEVYTSSILNQIIHWIICDSPVCKTSVTALSYTNAAMLVESGAKGIRIL